MTARNDKLLETLNEMRREKGLEPVRSFLGDLDPNYTKQDSNSESPLIPGDLEEPEQLTRAEPQNIDEFLEGDDGVEFEWIIPGFVERADRILFTGEAGAGKSTLLAQISVQCAAGVHPFSDEGISPLRVLFVDLENHPRELRRRFRRLRISAGDRLEPELLRIISRPEGMDIAAEEEDRAFLAGTVDVVRPDLVVIGPIYKLASGDPEKETGAKPVAMFLDELRIRLDCSLFLEAHMPHDPKSGRPFGWSGWKRWPEIGLELTPAGLLRQWRPSRHETPSLPLALRRGGDWPFTVATNKRDVIWARILDHCQNLLIQPTVRDLESALEVSRSEIGRILSAHAEEWEGRWS